VSRWISRVIANLENIPEELRMTPQWVTWRAMERDGGIAKVPHNAVTGRRASVADRRKWCSFEEAVRALKSGNFDGVGFVFSESDPYTGVDLDDCRDPKTGELEGWARTIVDDLSGYAEISPSGTGVHVIVRGKVPTKGSGRPEVYSTKHFFTMTGETL
jgi:putative DNA primase/helicase